MRIAPFALLLLSACTGASGSLIPVKAVGSADGTLTGPQVFIAGVPVNALVKVHGTFTYTVQPMPPYLTYDGSWSYIVEPVAGREAEAQAAVLRGDILIRHEGQPAALNAPGSIARYQATLQRMYAPKPHPEDAPAPVPTPPPAPSKQVAESSTACTGPECDVPTSR